MANKLVLEVIADSNGLIKGLNQAQAAVDKFMKSSDAAGTSLGGGVNRALDAFRNLAGGGANAAGVLAGAFVAVTTAAFAMTVQAGRIAEETEQLAQKTGIAAASIEGLGVAMKRNGLESGSIALAMKGLSKEMVGVSAGTSSSIKLFQDMGVSLAVVEKGTGATLRAIADAFQKMPDGANKARMAVELFGKAGLDWIPILNKGGAALDDSMKKAAEFGLILTDTARGDLTVFDDAMDDMESALKGFAMQVGVAFAPSMTILVKAFTDVIVFTKNVFNQFADAASVLSIRLAGMVTSVQLISQTLFSLQAFSKAAWEETLNHVKAIDAWAASEIKGVQSAREAEKSLDALAVKQLDAAKAVEAHSSSQERLGQQIVASTKIQLAQIEAAGKQQERLGAGIVSGAQVTLRQQDAEGTRQELLGKRIHEEFVVSQAIAQNWVDAYMIEEDAAMARFKAEMDARDRNEEAQGRFIVQQATAAQQLKGFWTKQLEAVVASNAFSVGQIVTTWTSGVANAIVMGGDFVKQAWKSTQIAVIQGGLNMAVQWAASNALMVANTAATAGATTGIWAGATAAITGFFATVTAAFSAMFATMVGIITAVGTFVIGVLSAIAEALTATVFGIPWAGAILLGIAGIVAALALTDNLGFTKGGIGDFGSGTPATLHGKEAIIPLNTRGAAFMREALDMGSGRAQTITVPLYLDGREIARVVARSTPSAWRSIGASV
jgi:hypothetical protein